MAKHTPKQYYDGQGNLIIKPYRITDLAAIFDINRKTMRLWMNRYPHDLAKKEGKYFSIRQVEFMIEKFGLPKRLSMGREYEHLHSAA